MAGYNDNENNYDEDDDDDNDNGNKDNNSYNHYLVTKSAGQTELIAARDPLGLAESLR